MPARDLGTTPFRMRNGELDEVALTHSRSVSGQGEFYMRLGRAIAQSPDFDKAEIELALTGQGVEVSEISLEEQEGFFAEFTRLMEKPFPAAQDFFAERRARGLGVGETEDGQLVYQRTAS